MDVLAVAAPGLEDLLARELQAMGVQPVRKITGGVEFSGAMPFVWRANMWSRIASRVLVRMDEFHASSFHELERRAKRIDWHRYIAPGTAARFRVTCRKSRLYHSDAIAERLTKAAGATAGPVATTETDDDDDATDSSQLFIVRVADDTVTISADTSGDLLHRRGYRQAVGRAPLRETLAAAMLLGSGWNRSGTLIDPMCGSGTIAIEAAMMARGIPPGGQRSFAFESWPGHRADEWDAFVGQARSTTVGRAPGRIVASDRDAGAVAATAANAERAGVRDDIELSERAVSTIELPDGGGWLVSNPPYGLRVGESSVLRNLYARLGSIIRERGEGYLAGFLSADPALESQLKLALAEVFKTTNGGIPVRFILGGRPD
ncbi:MAG: THUMP domain-containing protein [Gemmatimonadaceae bacterium]